jgi:hypothetical protein
MKDDVKIEKKLHDFLRRERVLQRFKKNVQTQSKVAYPIFIDNIAKAFGWATTPEGYHFWSHLYTKFIDEK